MSNQRYSPEFKDEAVRQVIERGYSVSEVASRLGVSAHSLHKWVKAAKPDKSEQNDKELRDNWARFHRVLSYVSLWIKFVRGTRERVYKNFWTMEP